MDDRIITCTDVSTESIVIHESTCMDVYAESIGVHRSTCTDISTGTTVVCGSMCVYEKYEIHVPKRACIDTGRYHMGKDVVCRLIEGVGYVGLL